MCIRDSLWSLAEATGLDGQIAVCGAVGEKTVALASSPRLAEQALTEQPLAGIEPLGPANQERAMLVGLDFAQLVGAIGPWIEYGIRADAAKSSDDGEIPSEDSPEAAMVIGQVRAAVEILQCYRGAWSETLREGDAWLTHSVSTYEDLDE